MKYELRLSELLRHNPTLSKRPGVIKSIVDYTGLDRHQVALLLRNEVKYIPIESLSKLCDYLVEFGYASPDQLPGALFAVKPEHFWELIARRRKLEICVGVRRPTQVESADSAWIVASDAILLGSVLNGVSTLGGTEKHHSQKKKSKQKQQDLSGIHPDLLKQTLVWSPTSIDAEVANDVARNVHSGFTQAQGDNALICLGSVKSNPVVEMILATVFGGEPFRSEDQLPTASKRSVPFYFRFRDEDPQPTCSSAGMQLSRTESSEVPGIYYESADGTWELAGGQDSALVFYTYNESTGQLQMVLCGFSGRSTRMLASTLASHSDHFWPSVYKVHSLHIGALVIQYDSNLSRVDSTNVFGDEISRAPKIIPIPAESIARRLQR